MFFYVKICVFSLKKRDQQEYMKELSIVMEEPNVEQAATLLQRHFETAIEKDESLYKSACFGEEIDR